MGVPKFFRYTSERYPCLNELVKQYQIPDFDNMYLDMNGIIHNCSHPDDSNPHFRITEEKIFSDVFHYIEILFQIIKPKKLFFMAIDGVAPRAKMNQQRGRRFRSAREAEKLEEEAKAKGEVLPTEKRFDSNCITPGTVFMARLHEQLKYFVKKKMSTDPLWAKVKVVLSGHETPGEGEHKIMDYIRWARSQDDYDPNTRHCLYGLDADLIMLGMCTHEPHFALLREEVKFGKTTQRATSPEETNFYLLHLSLMREYLEQEFIEIKDNLPFPFDIEKVVDDWVLMGFLVGNDFIPNLPNMHISNDALPLLYKTYMTVLPTLDGYINEAGDLNLGRFEVFMQELAKIDKEKFQDTYADLKYFEAKTGRRPNAQERRQYKPNNDETFNVNIDDIKANKPDDELQALINATQDMFMDDECENDEDYEETSDEEATMEMEFVLHKKDYYMNKLDYSKVTDQVLLDQAEGYVRAIQWNLWYYYKGCPSWCWFYPHHYAPYMSDIKGFKDLKIEFELGEPFKPFEQLLAVLPAASKHLLPAPFHDLMTDEESPIVHYYPVNFETDLNGKRNDWEAVVLIPFIDEVNLLSAMAPCYQRLTEEEMMRNTHGPMLVYNWSSRSLGPAFAPSYFPPINECHAVETKVYRQELDVPVDKLKRGMLPNAKRDMLFPGFPTTRHLEYKTTLKKCKVKVFDQPSRNENMIIQLVNNQDTDPPLDGAANELLGKVVWVGWPHLTRAKVISVSNEKTRLHHVDRENNNMNGPGYTREDNHGNMRNQWISERSTIIEHNMNRLGIELGDVSVIIHAVNHKGYKYIIADNTQMALEPEWCTVPCGYALQAIVKDVSAHIVQEAGKYSTPQEAYPNGDSVFLLTQGQYYGCLATVMDSESVKSGRIKVQVTEAPEPVPKPPSAACPYRSANHAAAACGISAQMLSRITGSVFVVPGERNNLPTEQINKTNIGLNLKFNKKNQEVSGYTRRCKVTNAWLYSERCIDLVKTYARQFPELFDKIAHTLNNDVFWEAELWPGEVGAKKAQEVQAWLKTQPHSSALRRECGSDALEPEEMKVLAATLQQEIGALKGREKKLMLHVKWNLLYKCLCLNQGDRDTITPQCSQFEEGMRIQKDPNTRLSQYYKLTAIKDPSRLNDRCFKFEEAARIEREPVTKDTPHSQYYKLYKMTTKTVTIPIFPMQPELHQGNIPPDPKADFKIYDRVVCSARNITPPFGAKGTITAIYQPSDSNTVRLSDRLNAEPSYQVMFDEPFPGGMKEDLFDDDRFYRMLPTNMINISYGRKLRSAVVVHVEDSRHSAFASYSPPATRNQYNSSYARDAPRNAPPETRNVQPPKQILSRAQPAPAGPVTPATAQNAQGPDSATNLLRSLLKISENETDSAKRNNKNHNAQQNWRVKNEASAPEPLQPQRTQQHQPAHAPPAPHAAQQNWRAENAAANNVNKNRGTNEWTNNAHKNQPPVPPFPNFAPNPQPNQIPFPQFQNPHFQQRSHYQDPRFANQGLVRGQSFPKHLPNIGPNVTLGPSWNKDHSNQFLPTEHERPQPPSTAQPANQASNSSYKTNNPFVPLQVQTRRAHNQGGPSTRRNSEGVPAPKSMAPESQPASQQVQKGPEATQKPQRKKKLRLAANLPFQID